jgi:hypothetical protein
MAVGLVFLVFVITLALGVPISISLAITCISAGIFNPALPANTEYIFRKW